MNTSSPRQLMRRVPVALRALACAYGVLVALTTLDAITTVLTDPQVDPGHTLAGLVLGLLGLAVALGVMWVCSDLAMLYGPNVRARAVLRWFPVLLVLACCVPFALDDLRTLSTLVIVVQP